MDPSFVDAITKNLDTSCLDTSNLGCSLTNSSNLELSNSEYPNLNPWISVTHRNTIGADSSRDDASVDAKVTKAEEKFRDKARKLVKNKVQAKFKDFEMSEKDVDELEVELLEDLEETIQEQLKAYKDTLK